MKSYRDHLLEAAEAAYNGYVKHTRGKSLFTGDRIPDWKYITDEIREAWVSSAEAVLAFKILTSDVEVSPKPKKCTK
jgi:hypothetical protein